MDQALYGLKPLAMLSVIVYSVIGFAVFGVAFFIMTKISPISIAKEIEEDQTPGCWTDMEATSSLLCAETSQRG